MQNLEADVGRRHRLPHISWHSREANRRDFYKYSLNIPTWCVSSCHAPVQLSGLRSFTCHSSVTHSDTRFVQTNMSIKLTGSSTVGEIKKSYISQFHYCLEKEAWIFQNVFYIFSAAKSEFYKLAQTYGYITLLVHYSTRSSFIAVRKKYVHC